MTQQDGRCLHQLFEAQAARTPEATALVFGEEQLTYQELDRRANQLAHFLISLGVEPESLVGLCLQRSVEMIVGILGILKAGGAYVPLSPAYPAERLAFMIEDARTPLLLTQERLRTRLPPHGGKTLTLEQCAEAIRRQREDCPRVQLSASNLAYVIYTSGSTGLPKGVLVEHGGTYNTAVAHIELCGVRPDDRLLQFASFSFDTSILEILMALGAGAALYLIPQDALLVGEALAGFLREQAITMATLQPSVLATLPDGKLPALRTLISAGEACPAQLVARFGPGREFWNAYGPTEASVCVTLGRCTATGAPPTIGRPLPGVELHVLDAQRLPVRPGERGELYIGGAAVARGYLHRPELTAQRFLASPFGEGRLYQTGDCGRYREDGEIEFFGRLDNQVKLRGQRIELEEIESVLGTHQDVGQCAVAVTTDAAANQRLLAYLVPRLQPVVQPGAHQELDVARVQRTLVSRLRSFLQMKLPQHMVPTGFVFLERLPLLPTGKVDRRALPAPERIQHSGREEYVAPRDAIEEALVQIWTDLLGVNDVGINDNFFTLGGHSLLAIQSLHRIYSQLSISLPLYALFENPTIAKLARALEAVSQQQPDRRYVPIQPAPRTPSPPLSFAQEYMWRVGHQYPTVPGFNNTSALRVRGTLDTAALTRSLNAVIERHELLRTSFPAVDGNPVQQVGPALGLTLPIVDLSAAAEPEAEAQRLAMADLLLPFEQEVGPLLRARLVRLSPLEHVLYLTIHHLLVDGFSLHSVFLLELKAHYDALLTGQPANLPALKLQYVDFAIWQRQTLTEEVLAPQLAYWKEQLRDVPEVRLPTARVRTAPPTYCGERYQLVVPKSLRAKLEAFSHREGVTLYITLLASFQTLLFRMSGQLDIPVSTALSHQDRPELQDLIGVFVSPILIRTQFSGTASFRDILQRVRKRVLEAIANPDLSADKLLQLHHSQTQAPLVLNVTFLLDPPIPDLGPGWSLDRMGLFNGIASADLAVQLVESPEGLRGGIDYASDIFGPREIEELAADWLRLLAELVEHPERELAKRCEES